MIPEPQHYWKPIDPEWLLTMGFYPIGIGGDWMRHKEFDWLEMFEGEFHCSGRATTVKTRGQLRDFLTILRIPF